MTKTFGRDSILQIEDYFVVVEEVKIVKGDYFIDKLDPIILRKCAEDHIRGKIADELHTYDLDYCLKVIATIGKRIGDVPLIELPDELEQLALKEYPEIKASTTFENGTRERYRVEYDDNEEFREGFIKGYKANKGKYSEEDIRRAMIYALSAAFENPDLDEGGKPVNDLITTYINLQTKRPIKIVLEYVERDVDFSGNTNYLQILKTSIDNTIKPLEVEYA